MRFVKWFLIAMATVGLSLVLVGWWFSAPPPTGQSGPAADALARKVQAAVGHDAWQRTGALKWTFGGRNQHLWDKTRGFARVRWANLEVLLDLRGANGPHGSALRDGVALAGDDLAEQVQAGYKHHINDRFWLYPFATFFDAGVTRAIARDEDNHEGLLITYASGGVTPGDRYLWFVGPDGRPTAWRMWVKILPVGGVRAGWSQWQTLATGITVAGQHEGTIELLLTELASAPNLLALSDGKDPFAALTTLRNQPAPTSAPVRN
jgi:hypothetical protein